jgi:CheY-like chemotaxis protein/anti-sigma regulatory factor (Ser/Thr protein kinase)
MVKSGWHLLDLINDVLDLVSIENQRLEIISGAVDPVERILDCLDVMSPLAQERNVTLEFPNRSDCAGCCVQADALRLKQALLNLIVNAIKYNHQGGSVTVTCGLTNPDRLRINVADTGSGIAQEDLPHIFMPFNRGDKNSYAPAGVGVGLALTKQLVELMGGRVGVESVVGKGTVFWIELDCYQGAYSQDVLGSINIQDGEGLADGYHQVLLYVEDSSSHVRLMQVIVDGMAGIKLLVAHTPELGLEMADSHNPDLIILDINLPGMDGYDMLNKLQECEATKNTPVIAVSASAMPEEVEKGLRSGFRCYLTKPINVDVFRDAVNELLLETK